MGEGPYSVNKILAALRGGLMSATGDQTSICREGMPNDEIPMTNEGPQPK